MDAQTQLVAELYKTLNDAQKQEVCNMIDTLLSQQLNDQKSLDSHSAATENQDKGGFCVMQPYRCAVYSCLFFFRAVAGRPCVSVTAGLLRLLECAESGVYSLRASLKAVSSFRA